MHTNEIGDCVYKHVRTKYKRIHVICPKNSVVESLAKCTSFSHVVGIRRKMRSAASSRASTSERSVCRRVGPLTCFQILWVLLPRSVLSFQMLYQLELLVVGARRVSSEGLDPRHVFKFFGFPFSICFIFIIPNAVSARITGCWVAIKPAIRYSSCYFVQIITR